VPPFMVDAGEMTVVCARPWSEGVKYAYSTSKTDGGFKIKAWRKIVADRRPQNGDRWISMLHNGE
jgi:hypothetical protein